MPKISVVYRNLQSLRILISGGIFIFLVSVSGLAQYENLEFVPYEEKDGLTTNNVNCIIQDTEGFMWFGTDNGLNRFDGYGFTNYFNNPLDSTSLIHDHVLCFYISSDSTLWIGTQYGVCSYNSKTDNFIQYTEGYVDGYIRGFFEDNKHVVHMVNDRGQIYSIVDNKLNSLYNLNLQVYCFIKDAESRFWFGSEKGLFCYDVKTDTLISYRLNLNSRFNNIAVFYLLEDNDQIWIGTRGNGIFILSKESGVIRKFEKQLNFIKTIYKDSRGNILIGDTEGLKIFSKQSHRFYDYRPVEKDELSLSSNAVDAIYQDNQGNLWLGVKFGGIDLAYDNKGFRYIDYQSNDPVIKTKKTITSIAMDKKNYLWMGAYTDGLERINPAYNSSIYYPCTSSERKGLQCGSVYELYFENDSVLWIGTYFGGLQKYNINTKRFTYYMYDPADKYSIAGNDIRSICEDHEGNMWIISHGSGINKWDRNTNRFYSFKHNPADPNSLVNNWAFHLICDSKGYIWVATPFGLSVLRNGTVFDNYQHNPLDTNSLLSSEIFTLFEDSHQQIWIGTREGLNKFIDSTNSFGKVTTRDGLIDNYICSILEDRSGNLWIATKKGLSRYNPSDGMVENFDTGDGLQDNEFIENSCLKTPDGYMYFGGLNRGTWFHPDSLKENTIAPKVYITDLKLFNRSVPVGGEADEKILERHIRFTDKIVLSYKHKVISFTYTALNFIHPEKNRYAYKLENFDEDWNYVADRREVTYTNLAPGKYVFRVKASNNDQYWNEKGASLKITILPPFWRTWWFRFFILFTFLLLIILVFYLRVQRIRLINITLEKTIKERTGELQTKNEILSQKTDQLNTTNALLEERQKQIIEQTEELTTKNEQLFQTSGELQQRKERLEEINQRLRELNAMKDKFFSIIGHDLKNPVNVIKGFADLLTQEYDELDDDARKNYLMHIHKTIDKTYDLLEDLLNWAQSQSGTLRYSPVSVNIHHILQNNISLFKEQAAEKKITLKKQLDDLHIIGYADQNMMNAVVRNLLSNAIKFTSEKGVVTVGCGKYTDENFLLISVKDTGTGISANDMDNLFRIDRNSSTFGTAGEPGTGLGLILCKEFVERNGGNIWAESTPGEGSMFYFTIPKHEHISKSDT